MLPDLRRGLELLALRNAAKPDDYHRRILWIGCIQGRATIRAEDLGPSVSALGGLDIGLWTALEVEIPAGHSDKCSEGCTG